MSVKGHYLAWRLRGLLPTVEAYGPCVLNDILPGFANLEARADEISDQEFARLGAEPAGEDCDGDLSGAAEQAQEKGQVFYDTMVSLRQATLNLFSAGLFHLTEQQLTELCRDGAFLIDPPDTKLGSVRKWYRNHFRLDLPAITNWALLDELRLVANAVKHGEGSSARQLRDRRPELFENPRLKELGDTGGDVELPLRVPLAGDDLYVTDEQFAAYVTAIVEFFRALIEHFEEHADEDYPTLSKWDLLKIYAGLGAQPPAAPADGAE